MEPPQTNFEEFFKIVKLLKNKKCNINDFSPTIIKENAHLLAAPVVMLFNQSITQGKFPDLLKKARVITLYKKGQNQI